MEIIIGVIALLIGLLIGFLIDKGPLNKKIGQFEILIDRAQPIPLQI